MLAAPLRMVDLVLGERRRFATNVAQEHRLPSLLLVLTVATAAFALPFGAVLGLGGFWRVAALLLGGLAICVPSLHVFGKYLGAGLSWAQTLCRIAGGDRGDVAVHAGVRADRRFLARTMTDIAVGARPPTMAVVLLVCAFAAGIGQLFRLLRGEPALRAHRPVADPGARSRGSCCTSSSRFASPACSGSAA